MKAVKKIYVFRKLCISKKVPMCTVCAMIKHLVCMRHKIFHTFVYKYHIVHRKKCKGQNTIEPFPFFPLHCKHAREWPSYFCGDLVCIWCVISITSKVCNCNFLFQLRLLKYRLGAMPSMVNWIMFLGYAA